MRFHSMMLIAALWASPAWGAEREAARRGAGTWMGRPVVFQVQDGWALVEGDILLAPLGELQSGPAKADAGRAASATSRDLMLWDKGVIPYAIEDGFPRPERVKEAITHWQERTSIRFVERTTEGGWVTFRRSSSGCSATVGNRGPASVVNLSSGCDTAATVHEIGHVVGLFHTQSRIDRDRHLRVLYENIDRLEWPQYDQHITDGRDIGPYDFGSVMHYPATGFSSNGGRTMETVPAGIPIGEAELLSALDVHAVETLYGKAPSRTVISTSPAGLKVLVDGVEFTAPAVFEWAAGEIHTVHAAASQEAAAEPGVRYEFANWTDGGEAGHSVTVGAKAEVVEARYRRLLKLTGSVNAGSAEAARVELEPESADGYYLEGTRVRLKAVAGEGEKFLGWRWMQAEKDQFPALDLGRAANPLEWLVEGKTAGLTADFTAKPLTTITSDAPNLLVAVDGRFMATPASFAWEAGTEHEILGWWGSNYSGSSYYEPLRWKTPDNTVDDWTLDWKAGDGPATLTAECTRWHLVAPAVNYYISGAAPDAYDLVFNPETFDYYFEEGAEVEVTPPTSQLWKFVNWYGDAHGNGIPLRLNVGEPRVVVANFLSFGGLNGGAIVNDASRQPGVVTPGERLRIHWNGSNPAEPVMAPAGAVLPLSLGGVEVRFDGQRAGLVSVSKDEVVCVVPESLKGQRMVTIMVVNGRLGTNGVETAVMSRSPGVYTVDGSGRGAALDQAVRHGEAVEVAATGVDGADETLVLVGGQTVPAEAVEADPARPGIFRVRFTLPANLKPGAAPLFVLSGGRASQPGVRLMVE